MNSAKVCKNACREGVIVSMVSMVSAGGDNVDFVNLGVLYPRGDAREIDTEMIFDKDGNVRTMTGFTDIGKLFVEMVRLTNFR